MSRRSTSAKLVSERTFPVRVRLPVPSAGLGQLLNDLHSWLAGGLGRGNYAIHCYRDIGREDELSIYLQSGEAAADLKRWLKERVI